MRHRPAVIGAAVAALLVAACGSDDEGGAASTAPASVTASELDGRSFVSSDVTGHELADDSEIELWFEDGRLAANAGCNTLTGAFTLENGALTGGPLAMTQMACDKPLMDQDLWLNDFLSAGPEVTLDGSTLTLTGPDATVVLEEIQPADLSGPTWVVTGVVANDAVSSVPADARATLTFTDGTVDVDTGCNTGSGEIEVTESTIEFGAIALTLRACSPELTELEATVVEVLSGEASYEITGDTLSLRATAEDGGEIGLDLTAS